MMYASPPSPQTTFVHLSEIKLMTSGPDLKNCYFLHKLNFDLLVCHNMLLMGSFWILGKRRSLFVLVLKTKLFVFVCLCQLCKQRCLFMFVSVGFVNKAVFLFIYVALLNKAVNFCLFICHQNPFILYDDPLSFCMTPQNTQGTCQLCTIKQCSLCAYLDKIGRHTK